MPTEQYTPPATDQYPQRTGTTFEHGNQIDLHASDLALLEAERARADISAATQPLEEAVQKRLEYAPLSPQEVVKLIGRKVVFDLRKGYNETHINLFEESADAAPYFDSPANVQAQAPTKNDMDLAA
ncbi:MAG: hypothetical protein JWM07_473 [Candidatus Saccharibacteria bacterium]|jgi:hypothetical protein|nr:hypothetical protein [Candidatus Saccharibacteria bacterium]